MVMNVGTTAATLPTKTTGSASSSTTSAAANALETPQQIQDRFLTLLLAQLQNQDPLSPVDNAAITQQMSQISMVQGIANLNSSMTALLASQSSQAAGLIGHTVLTSGNGLDLSGGAAYGAAKLAGAATDVQIDVLGPSGSVVDTLALGQHGAGDLSFAWDGKNSQGTPLPDGSYTFKVRATAGGAAVSADTFAAGRVTGVTLSSTGPMLDLNSGRQVALTAVKQIL